MKPRGPAIMLPGRCKAISGFNLARWILVVTLGCSLGLLFIYAVVSARGFSRVAPPPRSVRLVRPAAGPQFKLSGAAVGAELTNVIAAQLAAFRQDDYPEAYRFAASTLKRQLTLPVFERMVRTGYPPIAKSRAAQFGVMIDDGEEAVVNVMVEGASGGARHYQYRLLREPAGWKITAVSEVRSTGTTL